MTGISAANAGAAMPNKATDPTATNKNFFFVFSPSPSLFDLSEAIDAPATASNVAVELRLISKFRLDGRRFDAEIVCPDGNFRFFKYGQFSSMAEGWPVAAAHEPTGETFRTSGNGADYGELRRFPTRENALRFLSANE